MKTKSNKSGFARLRSKPIIWNFILIMVTLAALAIVAYLGLSFGTRHGKQLTVPNFTGLSLSDAQYYASKRGLNIIVSDSLFVPAYPGGIVLEQLPKGGVAVKKGANAICGGQISAPGKEYARGCGIWYRHACLC